MSFFGEILKEVGRIIVDTKSLDNEGIDDLNQLDIETSEDDSINKEVFGTSIKYEKKSLFR